MALPVFMKLQKIDAAKEYYQRKVDFLTQQMEKLQAVLREKYDMKEGMMWFYKVFKNNLPLFFSCFHIFYKKHICRRETTWRCLSMNILLSHLRTFETILLSRACVSPISNSTETVCIPYCFWDIQRQKGRDLETGDRRSLKMAPFDRSYTTFYWSAIVSILYIA